MTVYDGDKRRYSQIAGHGFRILADAIEKDLPYQIKCPALLIYGEKDQAGSALRYNKMWHEDRNQAGMDQRCRPQLKH